MPIPVTVTLSPDLQRMITTLVTEAVAISKLEIQIMSEAVDRLTAEVAGIKGAAASAVVLLDGLAAYIKANAEDPAALNALADDLVATKTSLGDAVARDPVPESNPPPVA
jgi:hypothetical protein